jgi:hypothetical protein
VNQTIGGKKDQPSQPPKNSVTIIADVSTIDRYSPTM